MMSTVDSAATTRSYPVDAQHSRLSLVVVLVFLVTTVLGYILIAAVLNNQSVSILALLGAFAVAYVIATAVERTLKTRWPSGRTVDVDGSGVRIARRGVVEQEIRASRPTSALFWRFPTPRRSRVPKGWYVLAVALIQDDHYLPVYTLVPPSEGSSADIAERFTLLRAVKAQDAGAGGRDALLLAGEQRRLKEAEDHRWRDGAEMTPEFFRDYIAHLERDFPHWLSPG